ncbi:hypothetical protein B0T26DRAFT_529462 [Lasiosphaeria miniovina]|uniref:Uncharacterized protein n=1 Tax=Lasiosphaeria miniovina TaxID=1954250 RepID=A0AA39ZQD3_9PEZI|nr:uncharacterized protein B0T26DRAFT_529462 [Lasiosphaeria miniovina]KAK0701759.1 hypothetical protein B0T26DRAFT_529462 [Lasiosphaeria miniovina]
MARRPSSTASCLCQAKRLISARRAVGAPAAPPKLASTTSKYRFQSTPYLTGKRGPRSMYPTSPSMDEQRVLDGNWWRKQSSSRFDIWLRDPDGPYLRLRLIDTPGLDDSANKDFENMQEVLTELNALAKSNVEWQRSIKASVLIYNPNTQSQSRRDGYR